MTTSEKAVLALVACIGIIALSAPWVIEKGFTWNTFTLVSVNFGTGVVACVLVLVLTRAFPGSQPHLASFQDILAFLDHELAERPVFATQVRQCLEIGERMNRLGVEAIYETREAAYPDIARHIQNATVVHIATGSLHSFWVLYRELLVQKQQEGHCDIKIAVLDPDSSHAKSRALLDTGIRQGQSLYEGYIITINQVKAIISGCKTYDFCPPASVWVIDDVAYVTPYFYATRGGQSPCLKIRKVQGGLFNSFRASVEHLIADLSVSRTDSSAHR